MKIKDAIKLLQEYYNEFGNLEILDDLYNPARPYLTGDLDENNRIKKYFVKIMDDRDYENW